MKECPDEGRLQSFFDGELPADMMEQTARHVATCTRCCGAAREVENENAILLRALEPEMSAGVPTEQLRMAITSAIAELNSPPRSVVDGSVVRRSQWFSSLTDLFRFTPQRATVFASILAVIVLGSILAAVKLRNGQEATRPADTPLVKATPPATVAGSPVSTGPSNPPIEKVKSQSPRRNAPANVVRGEDRVAGVKLIPGERSYLKTIATLDIGLKDDQKSMSPATRAEYERNLKLVDYAIAATRSKAKRTPHDPDAAGFMFAAYQSKIDLLSTMTETARLAPH